jgi:hypothetical protein
MFKLKSLLLEQTVPGLNASLTLPEITFQSGDYHISKVDASKVAAAAQGIIDAYNDPKNQNLQTTLTIEAGATASEITPQMVKDYWSTAKKKPATGKANAAADNKLLVEYRAGTIYNILIKHIANTVLFDRNTSAGPMKYKKSVKDWQNIIKYATVLNPAADRKYAKGSIKVTGELEKEEKKENVVPCDFNWKSGKQRRAKAGQNYTWNSGPMYFSADVTDAMQFQGSIIDIPDCYYVKYGDQEYFSGFRGDNMLPKDKMLDWQYFKEMKAKGYAPRSAKLAKKNKLIKTYATKEKGIWKRRYAYELAFLIKEKGLLEAINAEIEKLGGTAKLATDLMPNYTKIITLLDELKPDLLNYRNLRDRKRREVFEAWVEGNDGGWKTDDSQTNTNVFKNRQDNTPIQFLCFAPLYSTGWSLKGKCVSA